MFSHLVGSLVHAARNVNLRRPCWGLLSYSLDTGNALVETLLRLSSRKLFVVTGKPRKETMVPLPRHPFNTVESFLKAIGRNCISHSNKFNGSWAELFSCDSEKLEKLGITNIRERKWILLWTGKYRIGIDPYYIPPSAKNVAKGEWKP